MLAHLRPGPGTVRPRMCRGVAAPLVPLGTLSGLCWAGQGQGKAVPMVTCWDVLLHLQWLQVPAEDNRALLTLEACAETATFYHLNTSLCSTVVFTECTLTAMRLQPPGSLVAIHTVSSFWIPLSEIQSYRPLCSLAPLLPWHWINEIDIFPATATNSTSKNKVYYLLWGVYFLICNAGRHEGICAFWPDLNRAQGCAGWGVM